MTKQRLWCPAKALIKLSECVDWLGAFTDRRLFLLVVAIRRLVSYLTKYNIGHVFWVLWKPYMSCCTFFCLSQDHWKTWLFRCPSCKDDAHSTCLLSFWRFLVVRRTYLWISASCKRYKQRAFAQVYLTALIPRLKLNILGNAAVLSKQTRFVCWSGKMEVWVRALFSEK